nr:hypothetical protein [Tanacetum cinerariifolium]
VVAANMVETDSSLSGTHLLCAVGRYQEACSQLQDAGCWTDAATLAATHLKGSDYARSASPFNCLTALSSFHCIFYVSSCYTRENMINWIIIQ